MKITEITAEKKENKIQRLAAYCRVSSDSADQLHSFAAQLRYYSNYEKQHPEFELVGIYADEGLSGTSMKKRAEMNRLIQDCEQGKIDRVIVKSISRFARNTHDLLQTLRLLKSYGVTVFFEEQSIDTSQLNSEMFLTFPGMIAQQESESISGNMRWSIRKRMESGDFNCCAPAYGFNMVDGELSVNEEEATVIRRIYDMYLQGVGKQAIANTLNSEHIPTKLGNYKWHHTSILQILNNERYMGDALLQKRFRTDTLPYRRVVNRGQKPKYYVENSNPSIVSKEVYEAVQRMQKDRSFCRNNNVNHILTQMLFCPVCGKAFRRLDNNGKHYWISSVVEKNECNCTKIRLKESSIFEVFSRMTYKLKDNRESLVESTLRYFERMQNRFSGNQDIICDIDREIAQLSAQNHVLAKLHNNGILNAAEYAEKTSEISNKITDLRIKRKKVLSADSDDVLIDELSELNQIIEGCTPKTDFDEKLFEQIIKKIEVKNNAQLQFRLLGDLEVTETIKGRARCKIREKANSVVRI